ncbi:DUF1054 family protein [Streptococcaceae bacterium ESL0729]|nr:DUF1054 family protein [Streptococcaceae bacterium ESL0729]
MFTKDSFKVFAPLDLDERMAEIRRVIQPTFQEILEGLAPLVSDKVRDTTHIHIAQHRRRTKNAPDSTWSAISTNKRGYKSEPHLQLGIWKNYIFMYLSMIDNPKGERSMANLLLDKVEALNSLPDDFVYSKDHTKDDYYPMSEGLEKALIRFRDVKKGEFEFGRIVDINSDLWDNPAALESYIKETYSHLLDFYKDLLAVNKAQDA